MLDVEGLMLLHLGMVDPGNLESHLTRLLCVKLRHEMRF
jgi:hypothetical protein